MMHHVLSTTVQSKTTYYILWFELEVSNFVDCKWYFEKDDTVYVATSYKTYISKFIFTCIAQLLINWTPWTVFRYIIVDTTNLHRLCNQLKTTFLFILFSRTTGYYTTHFPLNNTKIETNYCTDPQIQFLGFSYNSSSGRRTSPIFLFSSFHLSVMFYKSAKVVFNSSFKLSLIWRSLIIVVVEDINSALLYFFRIAL